MASLDRDALLAELRRAYDRLRRYRTLVLRTTTTIDSDPATLSEQLSQRLAQVMGGDVKTDADTEDLWHDLIRDLAPLRPIV